MIVDENWNPKNALNMTILPPFVNSKKNNAIRKMFLKKLCILQIFILEDFHTMY
jgi:hypothetical protein